MFNTFTKAVHFRCIVFASTISKLASNIREMRLWFDAKAKNSSYSAIYATARQQYKNKKTAKSKKISLTKGS